MWSVVSQLSSSSLEIIIFARLLLDNVVIAAFIWPRLPATYLVLHCVLVPGGVSPPVQRGLVQERILHPHHRPQIHSITNQVPAHYLHTIYTLSTHYLHIIYTLFTHYLHRSCWWT